MAKPDPDLGSGPLLKTLQNLAANDRYRGSQTPLIDVKQRLPDEFLPGETMAGGILAARQGKDDDAWTKARQKDSDPLQRLQIFATFVQKHAHLFGRNPAGIIQAARNWAFTGPVGDAAEQFIAAGELPWIARDPRPRPPGGKSPCLKVLKPDIGSLNKIAISRNGAWAVCGAATLLNVWNST